MFTNDKDAIMSMSYCTSKIPIKIVYLYKNKRNIQDINSVKILDKSMTKDRLILLVSHMKVEVLAVHHMMSCFPAISLWLSTLMSCSVDGIESSMAAPYDVSLIV